MKSIGYALFAMLLYAGQNVVLKEKLSKFNQAHVLSCIYAGMLPLALLAYWWTKQHGEKSKPLPPTLLTTALLVGAVYFIADCCYVTAYSTGANVMTVTTLVVLIPVVASFCQYFVKRELPNGWQIAGYCVAFVAILLVTKSNLIAAERPAP